ncbi:MAG: hypothetical protein U0326_34120 [Polyangiales bacterium]
MRLISAFLLGIAALSCATTEPARRRTTRRRPRATATARSPSAPPAPAPANNAPAATSAAALPAQPPRASGAPSPPDPRCREVTQRNAAVLARVAAIEPCSGAGVAALRESFDQCAQTADGAWAPELVEARDRGDSGACELDVRWRVTLFHRGGAVDEGDGATGRVDRSFHLTALGDEVQAYARLTFTATDLDDDHLPELVVAERFEDRGTHRSRVSTEVYTAAQGRVAVFEPTRAMAILGAEDVDDDGRVDFIVPSAYTWTEGVECGLNIFHDPISLLAHAQRGGGFSTSDDVAARHIRQVCPGPDAEPVAPRGDDAPDPVGLRIICRRLWGMSPEEALSPLRCEHFRAEPSLQCEHTARRLPPMEPGECPAHYDAWAHLPPPLRLR